MAIQKAIISENSLFSVSPETIAGDAIRYMTEKSVRVMPVIKDKKIVGFFSLDSILRSILPKSLMASGEPLEMDFLHGVTGDLREKLITMSGQLVCEHMKQDLVFVYPETSSTEVLRNLYVHGSPLAVIDKKSKEFVGIVTSQSMLKYIQETKF